MKKIKTTIRVNDELLNKVETFRIENNITSKNDAIISLLEFGLIKNAEDNKIEDYLIQIIKQNNLILKKLGSK